MATSAKSIVARLLFRLAHGVYYHPRWFFYPHLVLAALCIVYTRYNLEIHTDRSVLVSDDKEYKRIYLEFQKEFPSQDELVVVVESESPEKNRQFVERLAANLEGDTNMFTSVFYKGDLAMMGPKALLFLPEPELRGLQETLQDYRPFLVQFAEATNLVSLFNLVNTQFRTASRQTNQENRSLVKALPALERILAGADDALSRRGRSPAPGIGALFDEGEEAQSRMYITFGEGRIFLLTAQAIRKDLSLSAVERIREYIEQTELEVPGLNVGLTGESVLEADEMAQSQRDTILATIVSLIGVAVIFIYGYHETGRPLKATICLLVGLSYTMGFTTAVIGHLNVLTITFVPILVGLAIDFGVHLITRYEEELRHGRTEKVALEKAMVNTGFGIFTGAFTTAGAFFAMALAEFRGVSEMGIICGGGMLVCLVPMMTLLPVLLLRGRQNVMDHELGEQLDQQALVEIDRRARLENVWLRRPRLTVLITLLLCGVGLTQASKVRFDYNLLNMQSRGLPAVIFQDKLIASSDRSVLYGAVVADTVTQATNLLRAITNLPAVASVDTMATFLTEDQTTKLQLLRQVQQDAATIHFLPPDATPIEVTNLIQTLWSLHGYTGLAMREVADDEPEIHRALVSLRDSIGRLLVAIRVGERPVVQNKLTDFQQALFQDVHQTFHALRNQDATGRLVAEDLPEALRRRFVGQQGKHLLQVYPRKSIWDREAQEEFIKQLRMIDPKLTGTPVQLYEYTTLLRVSFEEAALYSLAAISILVFVHFRKISCVILALLPVAIGGLWTVSLMGWIGIPFNPANIMTLPLIVGIGVTNGIHILNRFSEEQNPSILAKSTGKAVLVSGLTTMCGFGSLMLADHRGIRSLGFVMSIGVCCCLIAGLTFLPAILNELNKRGWSIKRTQRDNARSTLGREEPR